MAIDKDIPNEPDRAKIEIEANEQEVEVQQEYCFKSKGYKCLAYGFKKT